MLHTWVPLGAAVLFFSILHALTLLRLEPVYPRAFKLSRGAGAAVLTGIGTAALLTGAPHWTEAFLYRQDDGDWMRYGMLVVYGHLVADYLWMGFGRLRYGIRPRKDLMIHHGLGMIGFGVALYLRVGYAIALLTMMTEILPVTTGLNAWGKRIASPLLEDGAGRARLHVIAWLRMPLWFTLLLLVSLVVLRGSAGDLLPAYLVALGGLAGLLSLDFYWIKKCRQNVDFY